MIEHLLYRGYKNSDEIEELICYPCHPKPLSPTLGATNVTHSGSGPLLSTKNVTHSGSGPTLGAINVTDNYCHCVPQVHWGYTRHLAGPS